jgi:hypothetical protein
MLLCDTCDHAFHMHCLKPRLKVVPKGQWHCSGCRKILPCETCGKLGAESGPRALVACEGCQVLHHPACIVSNKKGAQQNCQVKAMTGIVCITNDCNVSEPRTGTQSASKYVCP